jgi:putative DNA primase/helicase
LSVSTWTPADVAARLFPSHYDDLVNRSGLTLETVQAAGIYSEFDRARLARLLNRRGWPLHMGSGLVIPYRDADGTTIVFHRVKPERPQQRGGKSVKYLAPTGSTARAYFPPGVHQRIADGQVEVLLTEGEKKSLKATQEGFCCVSLPGVDCWHARKSTALLADLEAIKWSGRVVYIVFDSDAADNAQVRENECLLAAALAKRGAAVKVVRLPAGPKGAKVGLDDYLVAYGPGELRRLLDSAEDPIEPAPELLMEDASAADPADVAARILADCEQDGVSRLRFWRDGFYWWTKGRYVEKPNSEVRAKIVSQFGCDYKNIRRSHVSDVVEHIRAKSLLAGETEPPNWLSDSRGGHEWPTDECLVTKHGIVHLPSFVTGCEPSSVPATPTLFSTSALDFDLTLDTPPPATWHSFLNNLWGDDRQSIDALQELFGYCLTSDTRQQKIILIVGPKRSGKGTIARVLAGIVGKGNVAAPTLAGLSTNFGLWPLIGKTVAIISDARLSGRADQVAVVERLLSISGEDAITIDRKNLPPVTCRLATRFVILTNELPKLSDASGAIVSRMILLRLTRSFYGQEDHALTDKLLAEREGILLWAVEGWRRLRARGRFVQPDSALEALAEMGDLASPVTAFIRDCCNVDSLETVAVGDLFGVWESWCKSQGREKYAGSVQSFARDLLAAEPSVRRRRVRDDGGRTRVYEGVGLRVGF